MSMTNSLRTAYGESLVAEGALNQNLVVLEADLSKSTMGALFADAYPDRFFEMGIAEANMASVAAGLSIMGKVPFLASFAVFATGRCYDQIRTSICVPGLNVKICGSSAGLSDFGDGSTHQSVEDIALMRALPGMQVFCPADACEVRRIMAYMARNPGPMYIRICRNDLPIVTGEQGEFLPGAVYTLREGQDAVIFAMGAMVSRALEAAESLAARGIEAAVVNVPSLKPLDGAAIVALAGSHGVVVTAEEHSVIGGLHAAVMECLAPVGVAVHAVAIRDQFGTSAENYDVLMEEYGLAAANIEQAVIAACEKRGSEVGVQRA